MLFTLHIKLEATDTTGRSVEIPTDAAASQEEVQIRGGSAESKFGLQLQKLAPPPPARADGLEIFTINRKD